jgi:protocatechuate 3,4-dioxygenase beta subunit
MTKRSTTVILLVAAALFTGLGVWFANREDQARDEEMVGGGPTHAASTEAPPKETDAALSPAALEQARAGIEAAQKPVEPKPVAVAEKEPVRIRGRVLDLQGQPVPGADLTTRDGEDAPLSRSLADGSFEIATRSPYLVVVASSPSLATVRALAYRGEPIDDGIVVVAPVVPVSGTVVDERGLGLEGAEVSLRLDDAALASFPFPLDSTQAEPETKVKSGAGGAFSIPRSIAAPRAKLVADLAGFESAEAAAPLVPTTGVRIALKSSVPVVRFITGVVVRANGDPATKASVHLGDDKTGTDARGAFKLQVPEWVRDTQPLVAIEAGSQAASVPDFGRGLNASKEEPPPMRLVLGGAPLVIAGRIVDAQGKPQEDWVVGILHPTPVSVGRVPPITAESLTAGGSRKLETDKEGKFRIEGLLDREYELFAYDSKTLARIETGPIRAGTLDVELKLGPDAFAPKVTGYVVGRDGTPIAGAIVSLGQVIARDEGAQSWISGTSTTTDEKGGFEIVSVPRKFVHIDVGGDLVLPGSFPLEGLDLEQPLRLEVDRRCHFRVEGLPASDSARWIGAYDADGKELQVMAFQSGGWSSTSRQMVTTDKTRVYAVSESAVELRLYDTNDRVAAKKPMRLVPGQVTVIAW